MKTNEVNRKMVIEKDDKVMEITDIYESIMASDSPHESSVELFTQIYMNFFALALVEAQLQSEEPPCNQCLRGYNEDDRTTCLFSQAILKGIIHVCRGVETISKLYKYFVYPDIVAQLGAITAECKKVLSRCGQAR